MATPYIPVRDADLKAWAQNYLAVATATPAIYGFTAGNISALTTAVNDFITALDAYTADTRNSVNVATKTTAKTNLLAVVRGLSAPVRSNPGISNPDKLALGLNLPNPAPSPIPAPVTSPLLAVVAATPLAHTVRYADSDTPDKRSKPFGVVGLQLFVGLATAPITDPALCQLYGVFTKQPVQVGFDSADRGKVATYFGRWATRSGLHGVAQVGPLSSAVSFLVA